MCYIIYDIIMLSILGKGPTVYLIFSIASTTGRQQNCRNFQSDKMNSNFKAVDGEIVRLESLAHMDGPEGRLRPALHQDKMWWLWPFILSASS